MIVAACLFSYFVGHILESMYSLSDVLLKSLLASIRDPLMIMKRFPSML